MADNANAPSEDATVTFHVKAATGPKYTFSLPLSTTTIDLKNKLAEPDSANVPSTSQRLIYSGKVLKDHETLAAHNVKEGNTMHLVRSAASNQRQNPASSNTTSSSTGSQVPPGAGVPQNLSSGTGNDPLAGLTGARYAGFAGLPNMQELANPPTPDEMLRRLQDPSFAQQMNEALQNPQMIDMMVNMNPQLRAMGPQARQMLQSEGFRRMMTNPESLRAMMNMQNMMGGSPFGGMGGGQEAFPMPGATNTTDTEHHHQAQGQQPQGQDPTQQNPFASMFGPGMVNPFMMQPPAQNPSADGSTNTPNAQQQQQTNPFAALFAPGLAQPQGEQPGQTGDNATGMAPNPANPMGNNPMLANMYNNPMVREMMNNPQALQNAMQMLGGGGLGGMGGDPMAMFGGGGGFGGPPDNRPPEERFATQLRQLNEMGFFDFDRNVQALNRSGGDVNGALEWLFSQPQS